MPEPDLGNRTLSRVAALLDAVEGGGVNASELARRSGLSVSTAHRLAVAMSDVGLLRRNDSGSFDLGERFRRSALANLALPVLQDLRDRTGESAQLWVRSGDQRVCIAVADGTQELRATLPEGARLPLPHGSAGQLLAAEPEALAAVQHQGWVESLGRRTPGLGSVSAPVGEGDRVVAAVCLAVPLIRVTTSPGQEFGGLVRAAATTISTGFTAAHTS